MGKGIATQDQEPKRVSDRMNQKRNTPRHILIKIIKLNTKDKY